MRWLGERASRLLRQDRPDPRHDRVVRGDAGPLLVSFCNVGKGGGPFLAVVDRDTPAPRWVSPKNAPEAVGVTGLCWHEGLVCAAFQGPARTSTSSFRLLDPSDDFAAVSGGDVPLGVHSACSDGRDLWFAVSHEDALYRASPNSGTDGWSVEKVWTMPGSSGGGDENHLNAVGFAEGSLCVSGFGPKPEGGWWTDAESGFVLSVETGEKIVGPVHHPHSFLEDDGEIWTCESYGNRLVSAKGRAIEAPSSYLRGLVADDRHFYAGSSKRRMISESTGRAVPGMKAEKRGKCELYRIAKDGTKIEVVAGFSSERDEIYDLLPL